MELDYAKAFRIIRAASGLQQAELAARLPITASQLSLIESGKRSPSVKALDSVAVALGIPAALITLLASKPSDLDGKNDDDITDLAKAMLRMLVADREQPQ